MAAVNPVYELFTEATDCADRLTVADGASLLADAVARAREVIELPDWLPQFCALVEAMSEPDTAIAEPMFKRRSY